MYTLSGQVLSLNLLDRTLADWYMMGATLEENISWYNGYILHSVMMLSPLFVVWCGIGASGVALVRASLQGVYMKRDIVEMYLLTVSFLALLTFTIFLGIGAYNVVKILKPDLMMEEYTFLTHQTNQNFVRTYLRYSDTALPSDEEISRLREESYHAAIQADKHSAIQQLILSGIILIIAGTITGLHRVMLINMRSKEK